MEPRELRESGDQRRGNDCALHRWNSGLPRQWFQRPIRADLLDGRDAAADSVLPAPGVLTESLRINGNGAHRYASRFASAGCNFLQSVIIFGLWLKLHRVLLS